VILVTVIGRMKRGEVRTSKRLTMFRRLPIVALVALAALLLLRGAAIADNVSQLVEQLKTSDSDRVRLAAAVNLGKLGEGSDSVVLALSKAVANDDDKGVRAACAVSLAKVVTSKTKSSVRSLAIANLKQVAQNDSSDFVKQQAQNALNTITGSSGGSTSSGSSGGTTSSGGGGGIYVNIGPMSSKTGGANDAKFRAMMVKVATQTMSKNGPHMQTAWPGGTPSKSLLAQKGVSGFYVDGTLNQIKVTASGSGATISCKVSMLLADFPDKSVFGFLNGGASVTAGTSQSDQDLASQDCVQAVIENLIANKIIPTICSKAGGGSCP
jgi:hypothetical protein